MKEILQTAIMSVAAVIIVGFICLTVYESEKPTKEEIRLRALSVKEDLQWDLDKLEREKRMEQLEKDIAVTDSILNAN